MPWRIGRRTTCLEIIVDEMFQTCGRSRGGLSLVREGALRGLHGAGGVGGAAAGVFGRMRQSVGAERRRLGNAFAEKPAKRAGQFRLLLPVRRIISGRGRRLMVLVADSFSHVVFGGVRRRADYFRRLVWTRRAEIDFGQKLLYV